MGSGGRAGALSTTDCDVVVIGGGVAGLAAAMWLGRYRRSVVVLDSGEYRNRFVQEAHGVFGFDSIDPAVLLEGARQSLARYGTVAVQPTKAVSARGTKDGFIVSTEDDDVSTRRIVLCTGVVDVLPDVLGFYEHYGSSVFNCPACDGFEAQGRDIVVFGWSPDLVGFACSLLEWASTVTIVTDGRRFEGDRDACDRLAELGVAILEEVAVELVGQRGALEGVRLENGELVSCSMGFFHIGTRAVNDLAEQLGCEITEEGCVVVDESGKTTVDGVYAAGDLVPGVHLIQLAAASGTRAGIACARSLATIRP